MKINNLYESEDYKQALNLLIEQESEKRKGVRTALAEACQCQSSYISRVLNRDAHLSLEQIIAAADFFGHCGVLVSAGLNSQVHLFPSRGQRIIIRQIFDVVGRVGQQQTQTGDIARGGSGLKRFNTVSEFLAIHHD